MESTLRRTWAEIDLDAIEHNYHVLRARVGENVKFLGVVKADAYGHGAVQVSRLLEQLGAEGKTLKVHIKVDTGMSRLGYLCADEHFGTGVSGICDACRDNGACRPSSSLRTRSHSVLGAADA